MRLIKTAILAMTVLLSSLNAGADFATILRMGADVTHFVDKSSIYSAGFEDFDRDGIGERVDVGFYLDSERDHHGSPFGSFSLGKRFGDYYGFNFTGFAGVMVIGETDAALGSLVEFTEEVVVGYKRVGLGYKHFSNAGLSSVNQGRDYVSLTLAFPF